MPRPFETSPADLEDQIEAMVDATFADLQSQFLVLPRGEHYIEYKEFHAAYEVLRRETSAFQRFDEFSVLRALLADSLVFVVLRTILGVSPAEWAALAREERQTDIDQNMARKLDVDVRHRRDLFRKDGKPVRLANEKTKARVNALISVAVERISAGPSPPVTMTIDRLAKADTIDGLASLRNASANDIPYAMLLYERFLGRPFASHRDSVSELVGAVMENAVEERLRASNILVRKSGRAERIPGFDQAPDFVVPDEYTPAVIIEAKITSDDGTARDKVARIFRLASMRDELIRGGQSADDVFEVVACIDGRGFGVRRQDMRDIIRATKGKVFTLATLDQLIEHTRLKRFRA